MNQLERSSYYLICIHQCLYWKRFLIPKAVMLYCKFKDCARLFKIMKNNTMVFGHGAVPQSLWPQNGAFVRLLFFKRGIYPVMLITVFRSAITVVWMSAVCYSMFVTKTTLKVCLVMNNSYLQWENNSAASWGITFERLHGLLKGNDRFYIDILSFDEWMNES